MIVSNIIFSPFRSPKVPSGEYIFHIAAAPRKKADAQMCICKIGFMGYYWTAFSSAAPEMLLPHTTPPA
jgi:hypothetical protein